MEFGVVGSSFAAQPWRGFMQSAVQLGVEALELDARPNAHCGTWSPDLDPATIVEDLRAKNLRIGALAVEADLVQPDEEALRGAAETVKEAMDLSFCYRSEIVHLNPQRAKPGMSREAMLASLKRGCQAFLQHAEESAILVCVQPDPDLLRDADTFCGLIDECESYNLKVALDVLAFLRAMGDPEAVRLTVAALLDHTGHVILRDGKVDSGTGAVTEVPVGRGDCPVDMVVSELTASSFYRPFYVSYEGSEKPLDAVREGIRYFRDLPNRILAEMGLL